MRFFFFFCYMSTSVIEDFVWQKYPHHEWYDKYIIHYSQERKYIGSDVYRAQDIDASYDGYCELGAGRCPSVHICSLEGLNFALDSANFFERFQERHILFHEIFEGELGGSIHALSIKTQVPETQEA